MQGMRSLIVLLILGAIFIAAPLAYAQSDLPVTEDKQTSEQAFDQAFEQLKASRDIQFEHEAYEVTPPPPERKRSNFFDAIWRFIGSVFKFFAPLVSYAIWGVAAIMVIIIALAILRETTGFRLFNRSKARPKMGGQTIGYVPETEKARLLLEDADALAAAGRFEDAVRLLLNRSIADIENLGHAKIGQALTAREISSLKAIPLNARPAFSAIASIVERAVFAGQSLTKDGFLEARRAYEQFALPEAWSANG